MNNSEAARSRAEVADEVSKWTVGGGIVPVALFPLAVPILILTAIAVLPLLVPLLAAGLAVGVIALPILLFRKLGRSLGRLRPRERTPGAPAPKPVTGT
jgi:hypothetical protein